MLNSRLTENECVMFHQFTSPKSLEIMNQERIKQGKKPKTLAEHLGYITRESAVSDKNYYSDEKVEEIRKVVQSSGYLTRTEAIENHKEFFKNQSDDYIVGNINGENVRLSEYNKKISPLIQNLNTLEANGKFNIQNSIISFPPEKSKNMKGRINEEQLLNKINLCYQKHLKKLGYDLDNINIVICPHTNTEHFHLHIDVWEKNIDIRKNRKMEKWDLDVIESIKKDMVHIMNSELDNTNLIYGEMKKNLLIKNAKDLTLPKEMVIALDKEKNINFNSLKNKELKKDIKNFAINFYNDSGFEKYAYEKYKNDVVIYGEEKANKIFEANYNRNITDICNSIVKHVKVGNNFKITNLEDSLGIKNMNSKNIINTNNNDYYEKKYQYITCEHEREITIMKAKQNVNYLKYNLLWTSRNLSITRELINNFEKGFKEGWKEAEMKYEKEKK